MCRGFRLVVAESIAEVGLGVHVVVVVVPIQDTDIRNAGQRLEADARDDRGSRTSWVVQVVTSATSPVVDPMA